MRRLTFLLVSLILVAGSQAQPSQNTRSEISVSAISSVSAKPDIADFRISIIARERQATMAFKSYLRIYEELQASLKGIIDTTKLMTDNLIVTPFYDYKKPTHITPAYYQVRSSMSLTVPIPDLNSVLSRITSVEGVTIDGMEFRTKEQRKLEVAAILRATKEAHEKAEAIAKAEGMTDLKVKTLKASTAPPPVMPVYRAMSVESAGPSLSASSVSVSATVDVTYTAESK